VTALQIYRTTDVPKSVIADILLFFSRYRSFGKKLRFETCLYF